MTTKILCVSFKRWELHGHRREYQNDIILLGTVYSFVEILSIHTCTEGNEDYTKEAQNVHIIQTEKYSKVRTL